ncbi:hypothetical protein [Streptomyces shenzhenensis]|uniref:hypothetical protein n=1 Tax=Streptomyces shenzhenensis TaxID=943815 RepID=UPI0015F05A5F|nr:hypothetical protein [Streptomyces shenzhenensis]
MSAVQEWFKGGGFPELARAGHLGCADIGLGHWPIVTRPAEQDRIPAAVAGTLAATAAGTD